jgi:ABC-type polysaccharide/polyol phosphate export permease
VKRALSAAIGDLREIVTEQIAYRELLFELTRRDLILRYKQTAMGIAWAVGTPLINTAVFFVMFTRVARVDTGVPYLLFAYIGLAAWNFSASALRFSALSLTGNVTLVTKVYCPREVFPVSAVAVALVDFLVSCVIVVPLLVWYRIPLTSAACVLPLVVGAHICLTTAIALMIAMANLFYRDVKYVFELVLTVWMFASSVVYPVERIGGRLALVLSANPMATIISAYRRILLEGHAPDPVGFTATVIGSLVLLVASWTLFHRAEYAFAENV